MSFHYGPSYTSPVIKRLMLFTSIITLTSALINPFFTRFLEMDGPQELLELSWIGMNKLYFWQPITYLFVQDTTISGVTIFFLLALFFNMYVLWILGSMIQERDGTGHFLTLYFLGGVISGLLAVFTMPLAGQHLFLASPTSAILTLFTYWAMRFPDTELRLFFAFPIHVKWLLAGVLGGIVLITLSQWNPVSFVHYMTAIVVGYLYGTMVMGLHTPFSHSKAIDEAFSRAGEKIRHWTTRKKGHKAKVVDLQGEPLDDEAFIDSMLTKISKYGENALSSSEKRRMQSISEKKRKH